MSGFESVSTPTQPPQAPAQPPSPADENDLAPRPNESPFAGFIRQVRKCGRDSALGKDSLPNLVGFIAEAVNSGALDPNEKFKGDDGKETNAANFIFSVYAKEEGKKAVHERSKLSTRAQVSKINKVIQASAKPNINFRGTLERAREMRQGLFERYEKGKLKTAFDTYVSLARAQIKKDADLSEAEIEQESVRGEAEDPTTLKELKKLYSKAKKLVTGENKAGLKIDEESKEDLQFVVETLLAIVRKSEPGFDVSKPAEPAKPAEGAASGAPEQPQQPAPPAQQPEGSALDMPAQG